MRTFSWFLLRFVVALFIGSIGIAVAVQAAEPTEGRGAKRALLIGINKYRAVPKLQGSLNDIATMKQVLITRWGFPESNIQLLTDEQATREGMLTALNQFVKQTGPQDTVYIHYSGHGSQVEDLNGDEPDDKLDETLVPQDGRTGSVPDITDDELDAIFGRLPTKNAFIVLDSCHSGTATRSLDIRTRAVPQDTRVDLYRQAAPPEVRTRGNIQLLPANYVLMTGAASHQEALDGPVEGRYHGFFSYSLAKSLSSSPDTASPREIFRGIETELKRIQTHFGRTSMPEPQLEAPPDFMNRPLLRPLDTTTSISNSGGSSRLAWVEVRPGKPGTVILVNGLLLAAGPGSTWAIYPPGEASFVPGRALAIATVTQLAGQDATANLHPASKKIADRSRAVALMPAPSGEKIPIQVADITPAKRKQIEAVLAQHVPNAQIVGSDQSARYLVQSNGNDIQLLTADGLQLVSSFESDGDNWAAGLAVVLSRSANASELLTLDNPSSQLRIDVRVATATSTKPTTTTRGIKVIADTQAAKYHIRKQGKPRTEQNSLQLEVNVSANSYVTIVDVDSEGGINLLFPNNYQNRSFYGDGFIRANTPVLIPDSIKLGNKAGFYWDYSPPKGTDTIRVFTSTDLQTAQMIRDRITSLQALAEKQPAAVKTRSLAAGLHSLRQFLGSVAARGILTVADDTSHLPGTSASTPGYQPDMAIQSTAPPTALQQEIPTGTQPDIPPPATAYPATVEPSVVASAAPPADWAATSITITISE